MSPKLGSNSWFFEIFWVCWIVDILMFPYERRCIPNFMSQKPRDRFSRVILTGSTIGYLNSFYFRGKFGIVKKLTDRETKREYAGKFVRVSFIRKSLLPTSNDQVKFHVQPMILARRCPPRSQFVEWSLKSQIYNQSWNILLIAKNRNGHRYGTVSINFHFDLKTSSVNTKLNWPL